MPATVETRASNVWDTFAATLATRAGVTVPALAAGGSQVQAAPLRASPPDLPTLYATLLI